MKKQTSKTAEELHKNVPPNWYFISIRENILQRYWHGRRFDEVGRLIEPTGGRILDIGSADGVFTNVILEKSKADKVIGIDVLKSSVDWASKHWKRNGKLKFMIADAHKLPFESEYFDAVFAMEVLEHVHKPETVLSEVKRVLKKDGYAVFLVPTDSLLFRTLWENIWLKTRGKIWDETHIQTYRDDTLVKLSKKVGFKLVVNKKFILGMLQAIKLRK
jgi:ubiquinone/menaquinone biosynthesis C-methylase UbiE